MDRLPVKRGDVVVVDLDKGAVGVEKRKKRPCVVVQNDGGNRKSAFTIIVPLTDVKGYGNYPQHVVVDAAELGPDGKDSVVDCGHIRTIDRDQRIDGSRGVVARLSSATMLKIDAALRASLGLR